ncbi:MAG TPA: class I SAM-dependent methyltransferase [Phycisphaerae bacterium]|nr:class I SAM-dependent methyltransferase [Phycisphaerae bacterium]
MVTKPVELPDNFYEKAKPRLLRRVGRELSLAYRILDLGCGNCGLVQFLRKTYRQRVTGVDISDGSFPRHDAPLQRPSPLRCIKADAAHLNFVKDGVMDAVVSMWALHEMKNPGGVLREAFRVLRPGGEILIIDFPRNSLAQRLWNEKYYTLKGVVRLLREARLQDVRVKTIERGQIIWATGFRQAEEESER